LFFFFQNILCRFYFFHIELVETLLRSFSKTKYCWLLQYFPHIVFVLLQCFPACFFFKTIFVEFIFSILSWLRI
jgi:phosphotransferase system  glucose/maltose/N-acetylglucosamine-specific IIC component